MNSKFQKYFETYEIASPYVCNTKQPSEIYALFDDKLQDLIVWAREGIGRAFYANNWRVHEKLKQSNPGLVKFSQRGYRTNDDPVCKAQKFVPGSAHFKGMALDFDVKGMTAEQVRKWLYENQEDAPVRFRVEKGVNWVHVDVMPHKASDKAYFFNP